MPKRLLAAATAAFGLAASTVVASAGPAAADSPCRITGITPTSVVVGLTPISKRFDVRTSDCASRSHWDITLGDYDGYVYTSSPYQTFAPYTNSDAGANSVTAEVSNGDDFTTARSWANGFYLKRNTGWQGFNASPEPARKGKPISIKGRLLIVDWDNNRYQATSGATVRVQFRTKTGSYTTVKTVKGGRDGWVRTTVTAKRTGVWRLSYIGNSFAGAANAKGDAVTVK